MEDAAAAAANAAEAVAAAAHGGTHLDEEDEDAVADVDLPGAEEKAAADAGDLTGTGEKAAAETREGLLIGEGAAADAEVKLQTAEKAAAAEGEHEDTGVGVAAARGDGVAAEGVDEAAVDELEGGVGVPWAPRPLPFAGPLPFSWAARRAGPSAANAAPSCRRRPAHMPPGRSEHSAGSRATPVAKPKSIKAHVAWARPVVYPSTPREWQLPLLAC